MGSRGKRKELIGISIAILYSIVNVSAGLAFKSLLTFFGVKNELGKPLWTINAYFLAGTVVLSNIWMIISFFGMLNSYFIVAVGFLFLTFFVPGLQDSIRKPRTLSRSLVYIKNKQVLLALILVIVFQLAQAAYFTSPAGDADAFYFVIPKLISETGRIVAQPNYFVSSQIGLFTELHYSALISVYSVNTAKFFTLIYASSGLLLLLQVAHYLGSRRIGIISVIVFLLSSSFFVTHIYDGKVDIYGGVLGLAAIINAVIYVGNKRILFWLFSSLFFGAAIIAKFSNIPILIVAISCILIYKPVTLFLKNIKNGNLHISYFKDLSTSIDRNFFLMILLGLFLASISIIPHLIKNYIL